MNPNIIDKQLITWLIAQRNLSGKTQADLSMLLNKQQSFVSKYENLDRKLSISEFITICKTLNCDPTKIIKEIINGN